MPTSIPYPNLIQKEYILIAHLYTKIFVLINRCLEVCGLNLQMVCVDISHLVKTKICKQYKTFINYRN